MVRMDTPIEWRHAAATDGTAYLGKDHHDHLTAHAVDKDAKLGWEGGCAELSTCSRV